MRTKLIGLAAGLLGLSVLALGGTYAGFSDTEQFDADATAGTLHLRISPGGSDLTDPVSLANMHPGETRPYFLRITNDGSVAGDLGYAFSGIVNQENGCLPIEQEAGDDCSNTAGELGKKLKVTFYVLGATCSPSGGSLIEPAPFPADRDSNGFTGLGVTLGEDETRCVRADILFPHGTRDNEAQSDSTDFRFDFRLDQAS